MSAGGVRVEGLQRLVKDMQGLGVEVDDLKGVFGDLAKRGADLAASLAPRRTGRLAASIRGNKAKNKAVVTAGKARVPYAAVQEFGWPKRNIRAARFMRRMDEKISPDAAKDIDAELTRLIHAKGLS